MTATLVIGLTPTVVSQLRTPLTDTKTTSPAFTLTPPKSNSNGAWTYTSSNAAIATVTSAGQVTPTGLITPLALTGSTTITATQAATTKFASVATTATLVIKNDYQVGDGGPGGGIVFYVVTTPFPCGENLTQSCTYLEAATTTSTWTPFTTAQWGCLSSYVPTGIQTTRVEIGRGRANTKLITGASCNVSTSAASIAKAYNGGGKTDWFLPSKNELNELYTRRAAVGGFAGGYDWSSSESLAGSAWYQLFDNGFQGSVSKNFSFYVRPVRAF